MDDTSKTAKSWVTFAGCVLVVVVLYWAQAVLVPFAVAIPIRQALAESRNAVAVWISEQIGIDSVLRTSRTLGVRTPLGRYPTTALGASEMNLLELANACTARWPRASWPSRT
jgi:hypothetical protein